MPEFHFSGQKLDNELVASISRLLDAAGVPNLLWGNYMLTLYGVPTIVDGASFVVSDALIEHSLRAIAEAGFLPCVQRSECHHANSKYCPPPAAHRHIDSELAVNLYKKSDLLWELPEDLNIPVRGNTKNNTSDIISASDARLPREILGRGQGRFPPHLCSIRVPVPVRYCESIILLLCRDRNSTRQPYWMAMVLYMLEYVDGTGAFGENELSEECRRFYHALKYGNSSLLVIVEELRRDLTESGRLLVEH